MFSVHILAAANGIVSEKQSDNLRLLSGTMGPIAANESISETSSPANHLTWYNLNQKMP